LGVKLTAEYAWNKHWKLTQRLCCDIVTCYAIPLVERLCFLHQNDVYAATCMDAGRPILVKYAQFWTNWPFLQPTSSFL